MNGGAQKKENAKRERNPARTRAGAVTPPA